MAEDAASCRSCIFRLRFGFRRALYQQLFLSNEPLVAFVRKLLGIKGDGDVARVMHVFLDVDMRGTHKLDIETFFEYFGIEFSEYNKRAFRLLAFGDGQDNPRGRRRSSTASSSTLSLKFDQFFVSMYNYGTLLHDALVRFAFDVMASGKEFCNRQDVIGLVSLLHSEKARVRDTTNTLMGIMDPHNRDKISFDTFRKEERRLGSMLFPAFKLQKTLRAKVLGQWFWRRATKRRRKARLVGADLCREYMKLKTEHLKGGKAVGDRRGSAGVGASAAAGGVIFEAEDGAGGLSPAPEKPGTDDEGYRAEGERGGNGTGEEYGGPTSSSSSGSEAEPEENTTQQQQQQQQQLEGRRVSIAAGDRGARRVSYAADLAPRGSMSLSSAGGRKESNGVPGRRRSTKAASIGSNSNIGRRRSSVALAAVSDQGIPGRRGSMFEGMQVYAPPAETPAAEDYAAGSGHRHQSSRKPSASSRVTPGDAPLISEHAEGG